MALVTGNKQPKNGVLQASPVAEPTIPVNSVAVTDAAFKSTTIDTKWVPRTSLLTHVEGSNWVVDYYSQILTTDSNLSGQQMTTSSVYQSYKLIKGMELKVNNPLTTDQDDSTKAMKVNGGSIIYPFIIPNEGDMFTADIGEGRLGLFRVTGTIKKSIFKEACYEISYGLDTDSLTKITDLNDRVVDTFFYHKDFLNYGQNPLIIKNDVDVLLELEKQFEIVIKNYMKRFFSHEFKTLMVPCQLTPVYDHYLVDYVLSQFDQGYANELIHMRKLNLNDDEVMKCDSIWSLLKSKDINYFNTCFKQVGLTSVTQFTGDPVLQGIRYSGFDKVVYPSDPVLTVDYLYRNNVKLLSTVPLDPSPTLPDTSATMVRAFNLRDVTTDVESVIYPVTKDTYYVLSADFYNKTQTQSVLEGIVWTYLEGKEIDSTQLLDTSKQYYKWGILEQFYYVPILLTLMKAKLRGF